MFTSKLRNQKILVVGGTSGIGLATARLAHHLGAKVTITGRDKDKLNSVLTEFDNQIKGSVLDIDIESDVNTFFNSISNLDHIYIAAGNTRIAKLTDGPLADLLRPFHTRLVGSLRVVRAAIPILNEGGSFVFTGGVSTDRPIAGAWVSGLGTASAEQLARVLVMEYPHIRFNAVSPGYTDTPMWDTVLGEAKQEVLATVAATLPTRKVASPEEVAQAVLLLMDNASITGEVLHIDGGARLV